MLGALSVLIMGSRQRTSVKEVGDPLKKTPSRVAGSSRTLWA